MEEYQSAFDTKENNKGRFLKEIKYFIRFVNVLIVLTVLSILLRIAEFIVQ